jgi:hypothetical protein
LFFSKVLSSNLGTCWPPMPGACFEFLFNQSERPLSLAA